jgi:hypothetical protein
MSGQSNLRGVVKRAEAYSVLYARYPRAHDGQASADLPFAEGRRAVLASPSGRRPCALGKGLWSRGRGRRTVETSPSVQELLVIRTPVAIVAIFAATQANAAWDYKETMDAFDGNTAYVLQADSSLPVEGTDLKEHYPFMQLRCDEDGGQAYWRIHWFAIIDLTPSNDVLGVVENIRMQARVNGKEDKREVWNWNKDETLEGVHTFRVSAVTKTLLGASELNLRIAGQFGKTHAATFDVSGLEAAMEKLRPHCKRL